LDGESDTVGQGVGQRRQLVVADVEQAEAAESRHVRGHGAEAVARGPQHLEADDREDGRRQIAQVAVADVQLQQAEPIHHHRRCRHLARTRRRNHRRKLNGRNLRRSGYTVQPIP